MKHLNHPAEGSRSRLRLSVLLIAVVLIAGWLRPSTSGEYVQETTETDQPFTSVEDENRQFSDAVGDLTEHMFGSPRQRQSAYEQEEEMRQAQSDALDERLRQEREERYKHEAEERYQDHQDYLQQQKEQEDRYYEQRKEEQGY